MTPGQLSVAFFLQLLVIIATCRVVGLLARRFLGQPQVVGEMIAGVVLGPSLLGLVAPGAAAALFPADTRPLLYVVAQLGVGLYMFTVGLDFRRDHFRRNARSAVAVSLSGIAAPFLVAAVLGPWLLGGALFGEGVTVPEAILFTGACISITAFPMLARILQERGLAHGPLGSLALAAGAIDDAAAWIVLAIVLASFGGGSAVAIKAIGGGGLFALLMLTVGPRLLAPLGARAEREGGVSGGLLSVVAMLFMGSAWAMDAAGIHAVFGGFLLGVAMPRGALADGVRRQVEPFASAVLVPVFFTYSGLNTQLGLLAGASLLPIALAVLVLSILAKGGACWAAARVTGQDNRSALAIGALMNARGLMELIIINIGLQKGVIGPALFSILVLMAIVTTVMASPLFDLVRGTAGRGGGAGDEGACAAASGR